MNKKRNVNNIIKIKDNVYIEFENLNKLIIFDLLNKSSEIFKSITNSLNKDNVQLLVVKNNFKKFNQTLTELIKEMHQRYELFVDYNVKDIYQYNMKKSEKIKFIFFIVEDIDKYINNRMKREKLFTLIRFCRASGIIVIFSTKNLSNKLNKIIIEVHKVLILSKDIPDEFKDFKLLKIENENMFLNFKVDTNSF